MELITGQNVHEAYNKIIMSDTMSKKWTHVPVSVTTWEEVSEEHKRLYNLMAHDLNEIVSQKITVLSNRDGGESQLIQAPKDANITIHWM